MARRRLRMGSVDALRGIAASGVVFYHLWNRFFPELSTQSHALVLPGKTSAGYWATFPIQFGYVGVTLFFVLSGFCIHWPQAQKFVAKGESRFSKIAFARRRFLRLYPAYFASIVLTSVILGVFPLAGAIVHGRFPHGIAEMFGIKDAAVNALFLQHFFPGSLKFNGVYWTLVYEVQFYAFYPALLLAARRLGFKPVMGVLLASEIVCIAWPPSVPNLFFARYFEWFLGMYAAERIASGKNRLPAGIVCAVGLSAGIGATMEPALWPYRDLILSVGFVGLLVWCVNAEMEDGNRWWAKLGILPFVGMFSYSLYLIHVPIVDLVWRGCMVLSLKHLAPTAVAKSLTLLAIPVAYFVAYWWYRFFEEPFMRSGKETQRVMASEAPGEAAAAAP